MGQSRFFGVLLGIAWVLVTCLQAGAQDAAGYADLKKLAERAIGLAEGGAALYVRALPPNFDASVPLPRGTLVGSVVRHASGTQVYYDLAPGAAEAYRAQLSANGWAVNRGFPHSGGFSPLSFESALYCKKGLPAFNVMYGSSDQNAITITTQQRAARLDPCEVLPAISRLIPQTPLPTLNQPAGTTMTTSRAGVQDGISGAKLVSAMPLSGIMDALGRQLTAAGWRRDTASLSGEVGTTTYTTTDADAHRWQAALTIYRSAVAPTTYYAFIDVTNLSDEQPSH